jgi:ribosomal protein L11 methyltransferase
MAWVAVRVELAEAAAETVAAFLVEAGAPAVVTAASDEPPPPPGRARLEAHVPAAEAPRILAALAEELPTVASAAATVAVAPLPAVDWEAVFRRHHVPTAVGARLLVAPPWEVPDAPGRHVLVIAPGMAFGTGQHPTTRTCLEEIEAVVGAGGIDSALDVGTGSGVLAAALACLGVPRVVALDVDPAVPAVARANLRRNAAGSVLLLAGRPAAVRARFALVVANLLADALVAEAPALAAAVAPSGHLIVSGLLAPQVPAVLAAYPGWRVAHARCEASWSTLRLVRAG